MKSILSSMYGVAVGLRNRLFDRGLLRTYVSSLPVICVGNLTVGGTGKTPLTLLTAKLLVQQGKRPVILSRGYGGTVRGPHLVSVDDDWQKVGDEPLLMARRGIAPVVISRSRVAGAHFIEKQQTGDVIVLDDGFQHRWLARSLNIVCIDAGSERGIGQFVSGELLPSGIFREARERGFERASAVVFSSRRTSPVDQDARDRLTAVIPSGLPRFETHIDQVVCCNTSGTVVALPPEALLLCGIANSEGFERTAREVGIAPIETYRYADHTFANEESLQVLREQFPNIPMVCTEKDQVKLDARAATGLLALRVDISIHPQDGFNELLSRACGGPVL